MVGKRCSPGPLMPQQGLQKTIAFTRRQNVRIASWRSVRLQDLRTPDFGFDGLPRLPAQPYDILASSVFEILSCIRSHSECLHLPCVALACTVQDSKNYCIAPDCQVSEYDRTQVRFR